MNKLLLVLRLKCDVLFNLPTQTRCGAEEAKGNYAPVAAEAEISSKHDVCSENAAAWATSDVLLLISCFCGPHVWIHWMKMPWNPIAGRNDKLTKGNKSMLPTSVCTVCSYMTQTKWNQWESETNTPDAGPNGADTSICQRSISHLPLMVTQAWTFKGCMRCMRTNNTNVHTHSVPSKRQRTPIRASPGGVCTLSLLLHVPTSQLADSEQPAGVSKAAADQISCKLELSRGAAHVMHPEDQSTSALIWG